LLAQTGNAGDNRDMAQSSRSRLLATGKCERRLLVVQHNVFVRNSLARYFQMHMGMVLVAEDPTVAEVYLRDSATPPTDLICGQRFGSQDLPGSELIRRWRLLCPTLERAVLVTAADEIPGTLEGINAIFQKPADPRAILEFLFAPDPPNGLVRRMAPCSWVSGDQQKE
jgi:hypothetical protein